MIVGCHGNNNNNNNRVALTHMIFVLVVSALLCTEKERQYIAHLVISP